MSPKETESQNVWFGVAMFLLGLISGAVLTIASGTTGIGNAPRQIGNVPSSAPSAAQQPVQPNVNVRMVSLAEEIGLDKADFEECVAKDGETHKAFINAQMAAGQAAGISGTPGNIIYDIKSKKGRIISGARPFDSFKTQIDEMLKNPNAAITDPSVQAAKEVAPIDFDTDHVYGDTNAAIAIIEYSDFECPFCHAVHPTYKQIMEQYDGKVMWVYRHFPLSFHAGAMPLAIGSECANQLGGNDAFWAYTDAIMSQ
jgi:protein-disulfide isomerase